MDCHCLPSVSPYSLCGRIVGRGLTALLPPLGTHPSTAFGSDFSRSNLCFAKAALIHHFPCALQGHEISPYINLRNINFKPIASDENLVFSK